METISETTENMIFNQKITMKDVAVESGLSKGTVSKVINNRPGISRDVRRRVLNACEKLNYRLDCNFQDLIQKSRSGSTRDLGVVIAGVNFGDLAYAQIVDGVTIAAQESNIRISLVRLSGKEKQVFDLPPALRDRRVSGFIITGSLSPELLGIMRKLDIPFIILGNYSNDVSIHAATVETDVNYMMMKMTEALVAEGKKEIACYFENPDNHYSQECQQAYRQAILSRNLAYREDLIFRGQGSRSGICGRFKQVLCSGQIEFDALLCIDYQLIMEICHYLLFHHAANQRISGKNIMLATTKPQLYHQLPLPTVFTRPVLKEMAETAIKELISHLENGVLESKKISLRPEISIDRHCIIDKLRS